MWHSRTSTLERQSSNNGRTSDIFRAYCLIDRPQLYLGGHYVQTKFSSAGVACLEPTGYFLPHTQFKRSSGFEFTLVLLRVKPLSLYVVCTGFPKQKHSTYYMTRACFCRHYLYAVLFCTDMIIHVCIPKFLM